MPPVSARPLALCTLLALVGCGDLKEFRGTYRAEIVEGNFVRSCFRSGTKATLRFDPELAVAAPAGTQSGPPNTLTTDDGTFQDTVLDPIGSLPHDPLSQFDFPGPQRLRNYLLLARPVAGPLAGRDAMIVVSLLASDGVELRIIARSADGVTSCAEEPGALDAGAADAGTAPEGATRREYFGLFRMSR